MIFDFDPQAERIFIQISLDQLYFIRRIQKIHSHLNTYCYSAKVKSVEILLFPLNLAFIVFIYIYYTNQDTDIYLVIFHLEISHKIAVKEALNLFPKDPGFIIKNIN